ncbi:MULTISPECIES: hypothetical protein [unclassified Brevundimonas]|uniref:hypothetical protein n=1 Tax=unclassified Brevundimonas TaxID=2622653 RepID=UPI0025C2F5C4|nr:MULTISPECIES: hypothetical protein [unclassified Brevundimonas]
MFGLRRAFAARRLSDANRSFARAYAARRDAEDRGDTRAMHHTRSALIRARSVQIAAELAFAAFAARPQRRRAASSPDAPTLRAQ